MSSSYHFNSPVDTGVQMVGDTESAGQSQDAQDAIEIAVQRFLAELEQATPEVQRAVVTRLLSGLVAKLPAGLPAKAIAAAKEPPTAAKPKGASTRGRGRRESDEDFARIDSQLALLSDSTDPILAWEHFGGTAQSLREVLRYEPTGALEAMLRHDRMPPGPRLRGKSRDALVNAIVVRLAAYFGVPE